MTVTLDELGEKVARVSALYAGRCNIRRDADWYALKLQEEAAGLLAQLLLFCRANEIDVEAALERKWFRHLSPIGTEPNQ